MRPFFLKVGATCLTLAATALSAAYVTGHIKNPAAPLRPAVLTSSQGANVTALGGNLTVGPSVKPGDVQPVTSTYAS
jgi:hypothetical protein